jgi:hypothetical protein
MTELIWYAGYALIHALLTWCGISAFLIGLRNLGFDLKVPFYLSFFVIWGILFLIGFVAGSPASDIYSPVTLWIFGLGILLGVLMWLDFLTLTHKNLMRKLFAYAVWLVASLMGLAVLRNIVRYSLPEYSTIIMAGAFGVVVYGFWWVRKRFSKPKDARQQITPPDRQKSGVR